MYLIHHIGVSVYVYRALECIVGTSTIVSVVTGAVLLVKCYRMLHIGAGIIIVIDMVC